MKHNDGIQAHFIFLLVLVAENAEVQSWISSYRDKFQD